MARALRIGVNALFLIPGGVGGTEIYLRQLLEAIAKRPRSHKFTVFVNRETGDDLIPDHPAFSVVKTGVSAASRPARILYEQMKLPGEAQKAGVEVMFNPGFTSPHFLKVPNVTLIHDLQHHRHPEYFKWKDLLAWRLLVSDSARNSKRILTVSTAAKEDIHAVYNVPLDQIHVAEPGVDEQFAGLDRRKTEPMILCVSTLHPHKNIERLIDAFAAFRVKRPEYKLVLAGMRGFHSEAVEKRIAHHNLGDFVRITGWIQRVEIYSLYSRARFAVFPSTFEGFGMPVVEAMAAGVPLITADARPMKDTAGDGALLFPPQDTAALTAAMETFAASETVRNVHVSKAKKRVLPYTWTRTSGITLDTIERAMSHPAI